MHPYRTAIALTLLLLLPHWASADPAEEQAIKQADKPTPVVQTFHNCPARGRGRTLSSGCIGVIGTLSATASAPRSP